MRKEKFIDIYVFDKYFNFGESYFPDWRIDEIREEGAFANDKIIIWHALNYSVKKSLGIPLEKLNPRKNNSGKLFIDKYHVSLSHSGGRFAVAISSHNIGVDIQKIRQMNEIMLNPESDVWCNNEKYILKENEDDMFFSHKLWTIKEAVYKFLDPKIEFNDKTKSLFDSTTFLANSFSFDYDGLYAYVTIVSELIDEGIEPKIYIK
jgi:phosphopantetheinyl transferase (holo-ACP synthase)